ncbi:MAG TPA: hypothetical protein VGI99_05705 [Gemmataceae bacterium]
MLARSLPRETPAIFDGPTVTIDPGYDSESQSYYLAHALGSIFQWSTDAATSQAMFDELHAAAASRGSERYAHAVAAHLAFEERSSGHAVWLLADLGHKRAVPGYTTFFRADMAALRVYHQNGTAPVWSDFFPAWKKKVACEGIELPPFEPRPVHRFQAIPIPKQKVFREEDGA